MWTEYKPSISNFYGEGILKDVKFVNKREIETYPFHVWKSKNITSKYLENSVCVSEGRVKERYQYSKTDFNDHSFRTRSYYSGPFYFDKKELVNSWPVPKILISLFI